MNHYFNDVVDKVKKDCESNLLFVERRLSFMKSMKRNLKSVALPNMLTHDETIQAWQQAIDLFKREGIK